MRQTSTNKNDRGKRDVMKLSIVQLYFTSYAKVDNFSVTLFKIITLSKPLQFLNVELSIFVMLLGIFIFFKLEQPEKGEVYDIIVFIPSGKFILSRLVQLLNPPIFSR